jgi:integrase
VYKRGSTWWVSFAFNGKRFKRSLRTADPAEAKEIEFELKKRIALGQLEETDSQKEEGLTFGKFAEKWIGIQASNVKPSTLRNYRSILDRVLLPTLGGFSLNKITTGKLVEFIAERRKGSVVRSRGGEKNLKTISPKTMINEVALLKMLFSHAKQWGYLSVNPAVDLKRPKKVKAEIEVLSPQELNALIQHTDKSYRVAFLTAALTGVRAGELWALKWEDLQLATNQLFIRRSVWNGQFQEPKTSNAKRRIDLPDDLVHELKKWRLACPPNEHDLIFPSPEGKIGSHDNIVKRHFNPALRRAKLRHVSFHSLRHSNASLRIKAGQNLKYLSKQMGHASVHFTLDVYGHLFDDPAFFRSQAAMLDGALNEKKAGGVPLEGVFSGVQLQKRESSITPNSLISFGSGG